VSIGAANLKSGIRCQISGVLGLFGAFRGQLIEQFQYIPPTSLFAPLSANYFRETANAFVGTAN
jgi:hypothetical protein